MFRNNINTLRITTICFFIPFFSVATYGDPLNQSPEIGCGDSNSCICKNTQICNLYDSKVQAISFKANEKKVIWWGVNLRGSINYSILTSNGENLIDEAWWVVYPFGSIKNIKPLKGVGNIEIPSISDFAIGAKLVFRPKVSSVIIVSDSVAVSSINLPIKW